MKYALKYKLQHSWLIHSEQSELENDTYWSLDLHPDQQLSYLNFSTICRTGSPLSLALNQISIDHPMKK